MDTFRIDPGQMSDIMNVMVDIRRQLTRLTEDAVASSEVGLCIACGQKYPVKLGHDDCPTPNGKDVSESGSDEVRRQIACICGSTSQREQMVDLNRRLTMEGKIVLAPGVFQHDGDPLTDAEKVGLDALHFNKIDMADEVHFIAKPDGSLGSSTTREYDHAKFSGKTIVNHEAVHYSRAVVDPDEALAKAMYDADPDDAGMTWEENIGSHDAFRTLARAAREYIGQE